MADIITNPPLQPYRYGLFSAATVITDGSFDPRQDEYTWRVQGCTPGGRWSYCWQDGADSQDPKAVPRDMWKEASPFVVYDGVRCMRVGEPDLDGIAEARLALSEQGQAERALWEQLGDEAAETDGAILADATAPFASVGDAIAALEAQLAATTGAAGVIHLPRYAATLQDLYVLYTREPSRMTTLLGTAVIAGGGYTYAGPDDATTDDVIWLYATGPVTVRRGDVQVYGGDTGGGFDQRSNEVTHIAERPYLITTECPIFAAAATVTNRPDTVWPDVPPRFQMTVDDSDPLNVTASFTGAQCDTVRMTWGDGTPGVSVPITDGSGSAAHNYETGQPADVSASTAPTPKKGR